MRFPYKINARKFVVVFVLGYILLFAFLLVAVSYLHYPAEAVGTIFYVVLFLVTFLSIAVSKEKTEEPTSQGSKAP